MENGTETALKQLRNCSEGGREGNVHRNCSEIRGNGINMDKSRGKNNGLNGGMLPLWTCVGPSRRRGRRQQVSAAGLPRHY